MIAKYGMLTLGMLLGLALIALGISRYQIVELQGEVKLLKQQKQEVIDTNNILTEKIQHQNERIGAMKLEAETNKKRYEDVISRMKPVFEKNEEQIKVIDRVQVTSDECKDLQNIVDAARGQS